MTPRGQAIKHHEDQIAALHGMQALMDARTPREDQVFTIEEYIAFHVEQIRQIRLLDEMLTIGQDL